MGVYLRVLAEGKERRPVSPPSFLENLTTRRIAKGDGWMFQTGFALAQKRDRMRRLSSGIPLVDDLLGGGFEAGLSYLFYGSPACTELLLRCVAAALRQVAPTGSVVVIDGNNGIHPTVLLDYLKAGSTPEPPTVFLNQLHLARAFTADQLLTLLSDASTTLHDACARILFVNGMTYLLQEEEDALASPRGRRDEPTNPSVFRRAQFAALLKQLAFTQEVAVIASADTPDRFNHPALRIGQVAHHTVHVLIHHARRDGGDTFTLEKHPSLPWQQRSTLADHPPRHRSPRNRAGASFHQATLFPEE
jgi:hypothetical protein